MAARRCASRTFVFLSESVALSGEIDANCVAAWPSMPSRAPKKGMCGATIRAISSLSYS